MNLTEILLSDFHNATALDMYLIAFVLIILGIAVGLLLLVIFKIDFLDFYRKGQIDAINGKAKYKLTENEDKEQVWEKL